MITSLELAIENNIQEICDLINLSYREKIGWTNESELVNGKRTHIDELLSLILDNNSYLLVMKNIRKIISCICLQIKPDNTIYIGLFAVHPEYQNKGIGKNMLCLSENYGISKLGARKFEMMVISDRKELLSYYKRRGYKRTGNIEKFPKHLNVGYPKSDNMFMEYLAKYVY